MGNLFCQRSSRLHLDDSLDFTENFPINSNSNSFCFELTPAQPFWRDVTPSLYYHPGLLGDIERYYEANQDWLQHVGTERLLAASRGFVQGALLCWPQTLAGHPDKAVACGLRRAEKTFKSKPPPLRLDVAFYQPDAAALSLIVDWE